MMYHKERPAPIPIQAGSSALKKLGAAWSPDGRFMWFAGRFSDWQYNAQFPQYQLAVYDREDGKTYPLIRMEISSASHPFYTGKQTLIDTAGRVDKFQERQKKAVALKAKKAAKKTSKDDTKPESGTDALKKLRKQVIAKDQSKK